MSTGRLLRRKQVHCRAREENSTLGEQSCQEAQGEKWELWRELGQWKKETLLKIAEVAACSTRKK